MANFLFRKLLKGSHEPCATSFVRSFWIRLENAFHSGSLYAASSIIQPKPLDTEIRKKNLL